MTTSAYTGDVSEALESSMYEMTAEPDVPRTHRGSAKPNRTLSSIGTLNHRHRPGEIERARVLGKPMNIDDKEERMILDPYRTRRMGMAALGCP